MRRKGHGFPRAGRAAPRDFFKGEPEGNHKEQPCQPEGNTFLTDFFTHVYILFIIGFRIGPPKPSMYFRRANTETY